MLNLGTVGIDVDEIAHWQVFDHLYEPCAIMAENPVMVITLKSGEKIKLTNKDAIYQVAVELNNRFGGSIRWE